MLCALGTIWEYRFHYNVFYGWSDKLLPGFFTVGHTESSAVDEIGRRIVIGPGEISLEAAAMLSMGLPDRPGRDHVVGALARAPALRPGREHPHGRRHLDLPQDARSSRRSRPS